MAIANAINQNTQTPQPVLPGGDWQFDATNFIVSATGDLSLVTTGSVCQLTATSASIVLSADPAGFFNIDGGTFIFNAQSGCILQSQGNDGGNMIIQVVTNDIQIQTLFGNIILDASGFVRSTTLPIASAVIGAPVYQPPPGCSYLIIEDATGNIVRLGGIS